MIDIEQVRAVLLCAGARCDRAVAAELATSLCLQPGFIHGVVLQLPGGQTVNTRVLDSAAASSVELTLSGEVGRLMLSGSDFSLPVTALPSGSSLVGRCPLAMRDSLSKFSLHSLTTLFCSPVDQCVYGLIGSPCTFCTYEMSGPIRRLEPELFSASLALISKSNKDLSSVAIGGSTPSLSDSGASYYGDLASRSVELGFATSVELAPPPSLERLRPLVESGVSAVTMSIELWDESIRRQVCLGKGTIDRSHYRDAWQWILGKLGPGSVSSVLLVGLEPLQSTLAGARALIADGVIPSLIPFRRYDRMAGDPESFTVDPQDYLDLSQVVRHELVWSGLDPRNQPGCAACGGCSMEIGLIPVPGALGVPLEEPGRVR